MSEVKASTTSSPEVRQEGQPSTNQESTTISFADLKIKHPNLLTLFSNGSRANVIVEFSTPGQIVTPRRYNDLDEARCNVLVEDVLRDKVEHVDLNLTFERNDDPSEKIVVTL